MSTQKEEAAAAATADEIILYDLPSKGTDNERHCWSLNPWKTRLALNYKGLAYRTVWVEYPEIKSVHVGNGIQPNKQGGPEYTIPAVYLPPPPATGEGKEKGLHMQDSRVIADRLEALHPHPSMHLDSEVLPQVEQLMPKIMSALTPVFMPRVPRHVLNPPSAAYFAETRAKRFGMPLDELEKSAKGDEAAWEAARPHLEEVARLLSRRGGPFFLGEEVGYVDFVWVAFLRFARCVGEDVFGRLCQVDESFGRLYEHCEKWLRRDDR